MYDFAKRQAWVFKVTPVKDMGCTALRHERKPGAKGKAWSVGTRHPAS